MSNPVAPADDPIDSFLEWSQPNPGSNRFALGCFDSGITIYDQQVRALNLVYCLHEKHGKELKIAVIGGGVAGLSVAAAATTLGMSVSLFERKPVLLHLQQGCETRWVHPHIYNWPEDGSSLPYAGLPMLTWEESTASDVSRQILSSFHDRYYNKVAIHHGVELLGVSDDNRVSWKGSSKIYDADGDSRYDVVVFAVGFGVERHTTDWQDSYWRNDSLNQIITDSGSDAPVVIVSGRGDGGLVDLLRACLKDFHQGRIVRELFPPGKTRLHEALRNIKKQFLSGEHKGKSSWLYDKYGALYNDTNLLDTAKEAVHDRKRTDQQVFLNANPKEISDVLTLEKASLLNTLLTYISHKVGAFSYRGGKCTASKDSVEIDGVHHECRRKSIRHGTDREEALRAAHFTEGADLCNELMARNEAKPSAIIWEPGWWGKAVGGASVEFVPPATQLVATTFISTLADVLRRFFEVPGAEDLAYRVTLHRLVHIRGGDYFQQICRYSGNRKEGEVGRVNKVDDGIVGLACRLGKPVIVQGDDANEVDEAVAALGASRLGSDPLGALLAVPFVHHGRAGRVVPLVLFLDTAKQVVFGEDDSFLKVLYHACRGFCENILTMKNNDELYFPNAEYPGYVSKLDPSDRELIDNHAALKETPLLAEVFEDSLKMDAVSSFNADFRRY
ncbi:FAD-dependent oxidoreductase [Botrimarina hoheduenensis]|uniref:Pyridine nucleotide-disulfide oxidoreductase n=1 Tax=Botrimarina hoheduenensis TaxID=2528000 RepID=A0A5C5WFY1_9BACT|nr:FAD-dependent oxidoreductase [Botrimarina hoheduenensis]TWT48999.1 Pyridine nucleotide-disulfide oxidoreductase [Botrimarina hoheduenensis]